MQPNVIIKLPNNTDIGTITHAAIESWAGFVYQGLCALCVAMEKLLSNENTINCYLNIEGYEDFAILDADKKILSFHQCKDYKGKKIWTDEFKKMEDKRCYWHQHGMCDADAQLYFHINMNVNYSHSVIGYPYRNRNMNPNVKDVFDMLQDLVDEYCEINNIETSAERASNRLIARIEEVVGVIDAEAKETTNETQQLSIKHSIPFCEIADLIRTSEDDRTLDEKIRKSMIYINVYLADCLMAHPNNHPDRIKDFLDRINGMNFEEKKHLVKCLFPDIDIEKGRNASTEISNRPRMNYLYNLLTQTIDELDLGNIHWQNEGILQSPSSMGRDMEAKRYCGLIAKNRNLPPELLRDYDWIVGDLDETVSDILGTAAVISSVNPTNYDDITKTRKTGLLSIKDKNDGKLR